MNQPAEEHRFEIMLGNLLRAGVLLAAAVVATGAVVYLARHGGEPPHFGQFRSEPEKLRTIPGILSEVAALHGRGIIQLGLLLLIATPVLRVAFSAFVFTRVRDWRYVVITLLVLALLCYSLFASAG
jgi:uncharacterized membrane protein